ncbi:putative transcription factor C2H2 family [Helianthus annuus]|nr:putative transcription factor C2H2 family [Helianthus annuus]
MAGNSPPQPPPAPPQPQPATVSNTPDPTGYWCYQCEKRVPVETVPNNPDLVCFECKNGFVESISVSVSNEETPAFGNEFVQVLRLIAQAAREDDEPPPPPPDSDRTADGWGDNDYLRIELDGWDNGNYIVTDEEDQEFRDQVRSRWYYDEEDDDDDIITNERIENRNVEQIDNQIENRIEEQIDDQIENRIDELNENGDDDVRRERRGVLRLRYLNDEHNEHDDDDDDVIRDSRDVLRFRHMNDEHNEHDDADDVRRERRDILRLRLRQVVSRAASRHNRILDWAEMLMGLEDQSIEFRLQVNDNDDDDSNDDAYVGNPGDYVDAAGYEALLQTLADSDSIGRRGAPPAAKSAVENLHTVEVNSSICNEICAVCKDNVVNNEGKVVKQLECGHMYHGECIVPWLGSRNSCPVCRFELPTDDPEYEEDRKRRLVTMAAAAAVGDHDGCSSNSGGVG